MLKLSPGKKETIVLRRLLLAQFGIASTGLTEPTICRSGNQSQGSETWTSHFVHSSSKPSICSRP